MNLYQKWIDAKEAEKAAIDLRRALEDELVEHFGIAKTLDGTQNIEADGYKVKVVGRLDRKVNSDKLQDLAAEFGLTQHLSSLFRWKPEVNATAWKSADPLITAPLQDAITTSNGRPSFTITKE
jgi:predicted methyltransferase